MIKPQQRFSEIIPPAHLTHEVKITPGAKARTNPILNPAPLRDTTGLHASARPHAEYFKDITFKQASPFNKLCEKIYSNITTLNTLDLSKYPNLPKTDINIIKFFQENNNALDQALSSLDSSNKLDLDDLTKDNERKTKLTELILNVNSAIILLDNSSFLVHLCQTTNPSRLSAIRLKQDIKKLEEQKTIIQSYSEGFKNKDVFKKEKDLPVNKGFGAQNQNSPGTKLDIESTLKQFTEVESPYRTYNFPGNTYIPSFIAALTIIQKPLTLLKQFQEENKILNKPLSEKKLKERINELIKNNLELSLENLKIDITLSKKKLKQALDTNPLKNKDTEPPDDKLTETAMEIGGRFYVDFISKLHNKVNYSDLPEISSLKEEINNNYIKYLGELVNYEQNSSSAESSPKNLTNLTPNEIIPPDLNFFPDGAPPNYSEKLLEFWENILQNRHVDKEGASFLVRNDMANKNFSKTHPSQDDLLKPGTNIEYLRQENFEMRTIGNYREIRFLIGLQTLAKNRDDLIIIVPNTVGWLNNRGGTDVLIIKKNKENKENAKILAVDCKSSESARKRHSNDNSPAIPYAPPNSNLYFKSKTKTVPADSLLIADPNQQLINDLITLFYRRGAKNLEIVNEIESKLIDKKISSNPSPNFYRLQDTKEAREFEKTISDALQEAYTQNQKSKTQ